MAPNHNYVVVEDCDDDSTSVSSMKMRTTLSIGSTRAPSEVDSLEDVVLCEDAKPKRWHAQSRRRLPVHPMPDASEQEWQVRTQKRKAAIELVTKSQEFQTCVLAGCNLPHAPDPSDRNISKRQWEAQITKFRDNLKSTSMTLQPSVSSVNAVSKSTRLRWADIVDDETNLH